MQLQHSKVSQVLPFSGPVLKGRRPSLSVAFRSCPAVLEKISVKLDLELCLTGKHSCPALLEKTSGKLNLELCLTWKLSQNFFVV